MIEKVFGAALGIGGATILGGILGIMLRGAARRFESIMMGLASGIMLAACGGLIGPAAESAGSIFTVGAGMMLGAAFIKAMDRCVPQLGRLMGIDPGGQGGILLMALAVGLHNLPEGMAAGIAFGSGDLTGAMAVASGIILHNIPEGMLVISPMLNAGAGVRRTMLMAAATGLAEIIGTLIGYYAAAFSSAIMPMSLAFAAGTMLYIIGSEMIPRQNLGGSRGTFAMVLGYFIMLAAGGSAA
ncbi:MAG: ZIP family metal transporter [Clostridia bacterium]|nr:ZIP family metal transporter [Clostridia bacterium]